MDEISGYTIVEKIGEGGMATVYKAIQASLNRPVAIKILAQKLADYPLLLDRFNRESVIIANLTNPHIIHVIDRGVTSSGMPYFVMEYIEGTDLSTSINNDELSYNRKLNLTIQMCKALAYAHNNDVIHRDIKPSNMLIDKEGNLQILDFGIAQFFDQNDEDSTRTRTGVVMGTIPYMSPEQQLSSDNVTIRSDLYSLGALMYELFVGKKPLGRFSLPTEVVPDFSKPLEEIIMKCMEPDVKNRPATSDEIKDVLLKLLRGAHIKTEQKKQADESISSANPKFSLLDVIKEEKHGSVYLYEENTRHTLVIIKKRPLSGTGYQETKLLASLKHKNIINIFGLSKTDKNYIIPMEYLSGGSLEDRLVQPFQLGEFVIIAKKICGGLLFAHKNRIVHGNLRPSNILFSEAGDVKVSDFALDEHYHNKKKNHNWYNFTGENITAQTDIFAVGVIFHQMLTGSMPAWLDTVLVENKTFKALPDLLQKILKKMLAHRRNERYKTFDMVLEELNKLIDGKGNIIQSKQSNKGGKEISLNPKQDKKRLIFLLFLFSLSIVFAAITVYFLSDDSYLNTFKELFEKAADCPVPSKQ